MQQQQQSRHRAIWTTDVHVAHVYACARATDVVTLESMIHMPIIAHTLKRVLMHVQIEAVYLFSIIYTSLSSCTIAALLSSIPLFRLLF